MNPTRRLQSTARLALLAMFLLLAAPLFSQAVAASAVPAWMSEMACGDAEHAPPSHDAPLWAQCGYCTLLLSSPALSGALPNLAGVAHFALHAVMAPLSAALGEPVIPHDAPPRAPPHRVV
ncbi:DUF2946 family protein [Pseudomonas sp. P3C3]